MTTKPLLFAALAAAFPLSPVLAQAPPAAQATASDIEGDWHGTLKTPLGTLPLVLHIVRSPDGAYATTLYSPSQTTRAIPTTKTTFADNALRVDVAAVQGGYTGKMSADGQSITGTWSQGGDLPLNLTRGKGASYAPPKRPQTPKKPYPYRSLDVTYPNPRAHIRLAGTLTLPPGRGPFPCALLITGSGQQDRDEGLLNHRPFLVLSDYLTRRDIAVLRVDDRGKGGSTGDFATATTADFATDVEAGLAFLKTHPEIDHRRTGLIGHSEGGVIAPMVAARRPKDVAFIVLMAGTGVPGDQVLLRQSALINRASGANKAASERDEREERGAFAILRRTRNTALARTRIRAMAARQGEKDTGEVEAFIASTTSPWFRYFLAYDPAPALRRVRCPVLAINGSKDKQVDPRQNLPAIRRALAGRRDVTIRELPGLNHMLQTAKTGAPSEYVNIEETLSPTALKVMGDWIVAHEKR